MAIKVTIWNEFRHEKTDPYVKEIYPKGMHETIKEYLLNNQDDKDSTTKQIIVRTAYIDQEEQGLPDSLIEDTDVLLWWGHTAHKEVDDVLVAKLVNRVQRGMSVIMLHSAHESKLFKALTGCSGSLLWRETGEKQILWNLKPNHPITKGINQYIEIEQEETYGEPFGIPEPDELIFISWFEGGNVFRSGWIKNIQNGKMFYFQPGHETYPSYKHPEVMLVIKNAIQYLAPVSIQEHVKSAHQKDPIIG